MKLLKNQLRKYETESPEGETEENLEVGEIVEESEVDIDSVQERKAPKKAYQLPSAELLANPVNIQGGMSRDELVDRANFPHHTESF